MGRGLGSEPGSMARDGAPDNSSAPVWPARRARQPGTDSEGSSALERQRRASEVGRQTTVEGPCGEAGPIRARTRQGEPGRPSEVMGRGTGETPWTHCRPRELTAPRERGRSGRTPRGPGQAQGIPSTSISASAGAGGPGGSPALPVCGSRRVIHFAARWLRVVRSMSSFPYTTRPR